MGLFGKPSEKPPNELVREWQSKMRKEGYIIDRQIRSIQKEEEKVKRSMKDSAKKGEKEACRILAKEIVNSRKAVNKLYSCKAQMNSVQMQMKNQVSVARLSGALQKSTEVMKAMGSLIKVPEIQATMMEMSKEMMKAGIMEEMLEDTMETLDEDELEEDVDSEVEKVLFELTQGELGKAPLVAQDSISVPEPEPEGATAEAEEDDMGDMQARLEMLRS